MPEPHYLEDQVLFFDWYCDDHNEFSMAKCLRAVAVRNRMILKKLFTLAKKNSFVDFDGAMLDCEEIGYAVQWMELDEYAKIPLFQLLIESRKAVAVRQKKYLLPLKVEPMVARADAVHVSVFEMGC